MISSKVADNEVQERYDKELMEFGVSSPLTTYVATLSMVYLVCLLGFVVNVALMDTITRRAYFETMAIQILLCVALVLINVPIYLGLFVRNDKGKVPSSVTTKSVSIALLICMIFYFV